MKKWIYLSLLFPLLICSAEDNTHNQLSEVEKNEGWELLFDGKSLEQWRNYNKETISPNWKIEGETFVRRDGGGDIITRKEYKDFELKMEWKIQEAGNSGIFLRGSEGKHPVYQKCIEVQILDNERHNDNKVKSHHAGAIYDFFAPPENISKPAGEWNSVFIKVVGGRYESYLNGTLMGKLDVHSPEWPKQLSKTKFKNWDGFGLNRKGFIGLQDHADDVWFRNVKIREIHDYIQPPQKTGNAWYERHNFGPFSQTHLAFGKDYPTLRGLVVDVGDARDHRALFDTGNLQFVGAWKGHINRHGTPWTGAHGGHPSAEGEVLWNSNIAPGIAGPDGTFANPREEQYGPLPEAWGHYNGLYRSGVDVVVDYSIGNTRVLEKPGYERAGESSAYTREINIASSNKEQRILIIDSDKKVSLDSSMSKRSQAKNTAFQLKEGLNVIIDRSKNDWSELAMGAPVKDDLAQGIAPQVVLGPGYFKAHKRAGEIKGGLPRLTDGEVAQNKDDVHRCSWFDGNKHAFTLDLAQSKNISRIHVYSWHKDYRAPLKFQLFASNATTMPDPSQDQGWEKIADVDTNPLGEGGKHAVAILKKDANLGSYRYLKISAPYESASFYTEIDVFEEGAKLATLKHPYHLKPKGDNLAVALTSNHDGLRLEQVNEKRVELVIPANSKDLKAKIFISKTPSLFDDLAQYVPASDLSAYIKGGPKHWPEEVVVKGERSADNAPYVTDKIPVPIKGPQFRSGDFDFFSDGTTAAFSTWNGEVWIAKGIDDDLDEIRWHKFAAGLFETLGICIADDKIYVIGKDQITRLHDLNNDGEADHYENFNNDIHMTKNFHEFVYGLRQDAQGNFYFGKAAPVRGGGRGFEHTTKHSGTILKVSPDGKDLEIFANGIRSACGIGVSPDGIATSGENEGTFMPACSIPYSKGGTFHGVCNENNGKKREDTYSKPLCWLPMNFDNSGGGQAWVPDDRWGPFKGDMIHLSYGKSSINKMFIEEVDGQVQGGGYKIPVKLSSSAMGARFNKRDGQLYVAGFRGWQTNASEPSAFQRIRYTGKQPFLPDGLETKKDGVIIRFTDELNPEEALDGERYNIKRWNYVRCEQYGSGHFSLDASPETIQKAIDAPSKGNMHVQDKVTIKSLSLLKDGKSVFVEYESQRPADTVEINVNLASKSGERFNDRIIQTIYNVPETSIDSAQVAQRAEVKKSGMNEDNLNQGLIVKPRQGNNGGIQRVARMAAVQLTKEDYPALQLKPGKRSIIDIEGFIKLEELSQLQFAFEGNVKQVRMSIPDSIFLKTKGKGIPEKNKARSKAQTIGPDYHPFKITLWTHDDGTVHFRPLWKVNDGEFESIPPSVFFHKKDDPKLQQDLAYARGREVAATHQCTACHKAEGNMPELEFKGPSLVGAADRLQASWVNEWLKNPEALRPQTRMPHLKLSEKDRLDVAAYIANMDGLLSTNDDVLAKKGGGVFHDLGCIACHTKPDQDTLDPQRIPLKWASAKFKQGALASFLKNPGEHHPRTRMPNFSLSDEEATALEAYLRMASKVSALTSNNGDAAHGKEVAKQVGCMNCHDTGEASTLQASPWAALKHAACNHAKYSLSKEEYEDLKIFQARQNDSFEEKVLVEVAERNVKQLQCTACHIRDGVPDKWTGLMAETEALKVEHEGTKHVAQDRPQITWAGEKLKQDYNHHLFSGTLPYKTRPWLHARMPSFPAYADDLSEGLAAAHGVAYEPKDTTPVDAAKAEIGKELIGATGLACVICHAVGDTPAMAAFEVEGVNLAYSYERLRKDFYHRWMMDPLAIVPNTRMPQYAIDGKTNQTKFYDGHATKQFEAMWEYLKEVSGE